MKMKSLLELVEKFQQASKKLRAYSIEHSKKMAVCRFYRDALRA